MIDLSKLKKIRTETLIMSQQKVADIIGCSRQTYCDWETGKHKPSFYYIPKLKELFNF